MWFSKKKYFIWLLILILVIEIFLIYYSYLINCDGKLHSHRFMSNNINIYEKKKSNRVFFLKTHKCASSTVQNILLRYGHQHNLDILLPTENNYIGNPKHFEVNMISRNFSTFDGKYDLFVHHTRYSQEIKLVMRPNTVFTTILREPSHLFESIHSFYHLDKKYNQSLSDIIRNYTFVKNINRYSKKFGLNQMSWDLGMNSMYFENDKEINNYIKIIERDFDLVMIFEYIEASLVLLAHLMKWPLKWVAHLPLNSRNQSLKKNLNEYEIKKLNKINNADSMLYNYFKQKFKEKVKEYGIEKMKKQISVLMGINEDLIDRCVLSKTNKGYAKTISYELKSNSDTFCKYYVILELKYTSLLSTLQNKRLNKITALDSLMNENET